MRKQELVKDLLERGRYMAVELNRLANTGDARKCISRLRTDFRNGIKGGADVQDEWHTNPKTKARYKVYWIPQNLTTRGGEQ